MPKYYLSLFSFDSERIDKYVYGDLKNDLIVTIIPLHRVFLNLSVCSEAQHGSLQIHPLDHSLSL